MASINSDDVDLSKVARACAVLTRPVAAQVTFSQNTKIMPSAPEITELLAFGGWRANFSISPISERMRAV